ncbi:hypothetical protein FMN63_02135 [Stappia sp. BW2]|uniref:hypothetical protein n=1 Tax=Stappia sp. BW2 TaxID=2592622 RepID=UPI0011DEC6F9|nr:hypothetical protein [Stappia sp. BW2]TYC80062.1 hypothetical protein FMN63_02135 [Stappia sp. BW2]
MSDQSMKSKSSWQPEPWRVKILNWHLLRGFGQSVPAAITMSTPFVGYMILYHPQIEEYVGGLGGLLEKQAKPGQCAPWIDFSMRLNLVYIGLLLLGVGTIVYKVFAPSVVKGARDINEYVVNVIDNVSARNLRSMYVMIRSRRPQVAASFIQMAPWLDRDKSLKTASDALKRDDGNHIKIDVLRSFYNVQDRHTARGAVYLVLVFYALGFLLLAIPGLAFTGRVLCVVWHDLGFWGS